LVGTYELIQHNEVSFPKPVNSDLEDLIRKLLDKDPKTRITIPQIKVHPWVTKNGTAALQDVKPAIELEAQDIKGAVSHLTHTMKNFDNIEKKMNNLASRIKRNIAKQKALQESSTNSLSGLDSTRDSVTSAGSFYSTSSEDDIEEVKVNLDDGEVIVIKKGANSTEGTTSATVQPPLATVSGLVPLQQNPTPAQQENKQLDIKINDPGLATKVVESKSSGMEEEAPLKKNKLFIS